MSRVLKWEGTLADPLGATLGVLVFQAVCNPILPLDEFADTLGEILVVCHPRIIAARGRALGVDEG